MCYKPYISSAQETSPSPKPVRPTKSDQLYNKQQPSFSNFTSDLADPQEVEAMEMGKQKKETQKN